MVEREPRRFSWWWEATPLARGVFALGLLLFAGSLGLGLAFSIAWLGHPPGVQLDPHGAGDRALDRGDLGQAALEYRLAYEIDRSDVHGLRKLGGLLDQTGDLQGARAAWERVVLLQPRQAQDRANLGSTLHRLGDLAGALAQFDAALTLQPDFADGHVARGHVLFDRGQHALAIEAFRQALQADPASARAWIGLGVVAGARGQYELAVRQFERALRIDPSLGDAHQNLQRARAALEAAQAGS